MIDILLVEDHKPDVRLTMEALKDAGIPNRLHVVSDGVEALAFLQRSDGHADAPAPDLILLDLNLPRVDGREVFRAIMHRKTWIPVIIVSGAKDERAGSYVRAGALDYVVKGELHCLGAAVTEAIAIRQALARLSPRQREVLRLIALGNSTRDIAASLMVSVKTIESHRAAVLKRLELGTVAELVRFAVRAGLVAA